MAVSPKDIEISPGEVTAANNLEIELDKRVRENFAGKDVAVVFQYHPGNCSTRVINEVVRRYMKAGWHKIEFAPSTNTWRFVSFH